MISIYSPHTVRRCAGDQNFRDRHILQRQPDEASRIDCQAGMLLHQHSGDGAAHSNGTAQLAQRFSMTMTLSHTRRGNLHGHDLQTKDDRMTQLDRPQRVSGATGAGFSFSRAFLTDAARRGLAASLRISATICASSECVRGWVCRHVSLSTMA